MRVSECYTFELAIITRSRYKRAALFTNGIISITSVLQYLSKTVTMVHTSKVYKYASYEEYRDNGMLSSEANCMHYAVPLRPEDCLPNLDSSISTTVTGPPIFVWVMRSSAIRWCILL